MKSETNKKRDIKCFFLYFFFDIVQIVHQVGQNFDRHPLASFFRLQHFQFDIFNWKCDAMQFTSLQICSFENSSADAGGEDPSERETLFRPREFAKIQIKALSFVGHDSISQLGNIKGTRNTVTQ